MGIESGALQKELGCAIAQLEDAKLRLLEVFGWGSRPQMVEDHDRQVYAMQLVCVQTALPLIDTHLSNAFEMITGNPFPFRVQPIARKPE